MAGNSKRQGARRDPSKKKGPLAGTGGHGRKKLEGRGATPPAEARPGHPAQRRAMVAAKQTGKRPPKVKDSPDLLVGRNPVVEAMRARIPATALYVAVGLDLDERVTEAMRRAGDRHLSIMEVSRPELDRITNGLLHQGLALQVPPYDYAHPDDLLTDIVGTPLIVALDGVTDPRNLGAVVRSAAAFGAQGVVLPERRASGMTASAWRTSAGAAARIRVARATNLTRALIAYQKAGLTVVGLDADADLSLDDLEASTDPLCLVVGSEGRGLSRLVGECCDLRVSIPITDATESLNASVAAGVALAEVARRRRLVG
ncbi:MAG TPA: 23S rRNA (guanosine(2251)-2'-O)-methyltransferase RlmB [Mycobacteriales bacterium]|jgi:23S rRNA (guanosine2251-2'-O)-methyltransferase|nr:23S rRNA (guanosine(2251)-2'-O)-methyltransferase RlmB [Mycobacteriales bacterium]